MQNLVIRTCLEGGQIQYLGTNSSCKRKELRLVRIEQQLS